MPSSRHERALRLLGFSAVAGVDEAGRGSLFGPVFAAAVILDPARPIRGLEDSKQLSPDRREFLSRRIRDRARAWAVGSADAFEIDHCNILEASRRAMQRAIAQLTPAADSLLIDFVKLPTDLPQRNLVHGDSLSFSIAAASILAKTARDHAMAAWGAVFPEFALASNKGYSSPDHLAALRRVGPTPLHRFSFEPVRAAGPHFDWQGYPIAREAGPIQGELFT